MSQRAGGLAFTRKTSLNNESVVRSSIPMHNQAWQTLSESKRRSSESGHKWSLGCWQVLIRDRDSNLICVSNEGLGDRGRPGPRDVLLSYLWHKPGKDVASLVGSGKEKQESSWSGPRGSRACIWSSHFQKAADEAIGSLKTALHLTCRVAGDHLAEACIVRLSWYQHFCSQWPTNGIQWFLILVSIPQQKLKWHTCYWKVLWHVVHDLFLFE